MKLADRIIDLMAPFPGRPFRMQELVKYIAPRVEEKSKKEALRKQIQRVLLELSECGTIRIQRADRQGSFSYYIWGKNDKRETKSTNNEYFGVQARN